MSGRACVRVLHEGFFSDSLCWFLCMYYITKAEQNIDVKMMLINVCVTFKLRHTSSQLPSWINFNHLHPSILDGCQMSIVPPGDCLKTHLGTQSCGRLRGIADRHGYDDQLQSCFTMGCTPTWMLDVPR